MFKEKELGKVRDSAKNFLELDKEQKIAIITDNDEDGLTAMLNMKSFLLEHGQDVRHFFYDHSERTTRLFERELSVFKPDKVVFLDLNNRFVSDIVSDFNDLIKTYLVIDHHQAEEALDISGEYLIINPDEFSDIDMSKYPASKMVYDLFGGKDWLALIGLIGDFSIDSWSDFIEGVKEKYSLSEGDVKEISEIVGCIISIYIDALPSLADFLVNTDNPKKIIDSDFALLKEEFQKRIYSEKKRFEETAEYYDDIDLVIFETKPKLASKLSNILSVDMHGKTVFVYSKFRGVVKGSMRRQDFKVDCNQLTRYGVDNCSGATGGGHIPATGCKMPEKCLDDFKMRIISYLRKNYKK